MTHYQERLDHDLARINESLSALATQVKNALRGAVHALLTGDEKQAYETILGDHAINRTMRRLDGLCYKFIAVHLPSAGHLRLISSVMRTNIALERIGDYAVTICRESVQLSRVPAGRVGQEIELMADESRSMLHQALAAFKQRNADVARATMTTADQVERTFDTVFDELVGQDSEWSKRDMFALLIVFHMLERVSDQAKNICEETVFAVTGQTKAPKTYRVLFLDEDNAGLSQMAQAIARSGVFESAGQHAANALNREMADFLSRRGCDVGAQAPKMLQPIGHELADYHVIVSLQGSVKNYMEQVPFHTTALQWELGPLPDSGDAEKADLRLEGLYREIALKVQDLMTTLRGEEAD
jgi:phosphate transport system protein